MITYTPWSLARTQSVETKAPIARKEYMEPPTSPLAPTAMQCPTERGTGLNTIDHGRFGVPSRPTSRYLSKEPVKRTKKVTKAAPKVPPTPDWHKKDEGHQGLAAPKVPPTPDWHKKDGTTTTAASPLQASCIPPNVRRACPAASVLTIFLRETVSHHT